MTVRIQLVKGDIATQADVDAIVAAIPVTMHVNSNTTRHIMEAAGPELDHALLDRATGARPGNVFALPGFALPVKTILFVVTPLWVDDFGRKDGDLVNCYRNPLDVAKRMGIRTIAFSAIAAGGRKGYPVERAARLAFQGIGDAIAPPLEEVRIVFSKPDVHAVFTAKMKSRGII